MQACSVLHENSSRSECAALPAAIWADKHQCWVPREGRPKLSTVIWLVLGTKTTTTAVWKYNESVRWQHCSFNVICGSSGCRPHSLLPPLTSHRPSVMVQQSNVFILLPAESRIVKNDEQTLPAMQHLIDTVWLQLDVTVDGLSNPQN